MGGCEPEASYELLECCIVSQFKSSPTVLEVKYFVVSIYFSFARVEQLGVLHSIQSRPQTFFLIALYLPCFLFGARFPTDCNVQILEFAFQDLFLISTDFLTKERSN